MGVSDRKDRAKVELRESILDAAKKILLDQGHEKLSIRKIATVIEYSPATIYLYFRDKDAIMHELMTLGFNKMNQFMAHAFSEKNPITRIKLIGESYVKFGLEQPDWYDLMFNSDKPMKHIEKCREDWDQGMQMFDLLCHTCQEAIDTLQLQKLEARVLALQLWSSVHGLVNLAQSDRLEIVEPNQAPQLIEKTLNSILFSIFKQ